MKLVSPPENWQQALDLTKATPKEVALFLARQNGLLAKEQDGKLYIGQQDRSVPAGQPAVKSGKLYIEGVPYYSQRDSQHAGQAGRMCFSSTMAMSLKFLKPGALTNSPNADDEYLARLRQYGDTVDPQAQLRTLRHFGIAATYRQDLDWDDVDTQLEQGRPVGIGWLIHGHVSSPGGGGHWSLVIGKSGDQYILHDPYGEADLVGGGYLDANGRNVRYSAENLGRRWKAGHVVGAYRYTPRSGWGVLFG